MYPSIGRYEVVELLLRTMTSLGIGGYRLPRSARIVVRIPVTSLHLVREVQLVARFLEVRILGSVDVQIFVIFGKDLTVLTRGSLLPHAGRYKIRPAEHLVQQHLEVGAFRIVDRHPDRPVFGQQIAQQLQARPHHGKPPSMFQVVVVVLERGAGVVRRIDVDALHTTSVKRQQCLQRLQVVPLDQPCCRTRLLRRTAREPPPAADRACARRHEYPALGSTSARSAWVCAYPSRRSAVNWQRKYTSEQPFSRAREKNTIDPAKAVIVAHDPFLRPGSLVRPGGFRAHMSVACGECAPFGPHRRFSWGWMKICRG